MKTVDEVPIDPQVCCSDGSRPGLAAPFLRRYDDEVAVEASDAYVAMSAPIELTEFQRGILGDEAVASVNENIRSASVRPLPAVRGMVPEGEPVATVIVNARHLRRALKALGPGNHAVVVETHVDDSPVVIRPVESMHSSPAEYRLADPHLFALVMPCRKGPIRGASA